MAKISTTTLQESLQQNVQMGCRIPCVEYRTEECDRYPLPPRGLLKSLLHGDRVSPKWPPCFAERESLSLPSQSLRATLRQGRHMVHLKEQPEVEARALEQEQCAAAPLPTIDVGNDEPSRQA